MKTNNNCKVRYLLSSLVVQGPESSHSAAQRCSRGASAYNKKTLFYCDIRAAAGWPGGRTTGTSTGGNRPAKPEAKGKTGLSVHTLPELSLSLLPPSLSLSLSLSRPAPLHLAEQQSPHRVCSITQHRGRPLLCSAASAGQQQQVQLRSLQDEAHCSRGLLCLCRRSS